MGTHTKAYNLDGPTYNKILIYNSLCYFATRIVYAGITVTLDKGIWWGFPCLDYSIDVL